MLSMLPKIPITAISSASVYTTPHHTDAKTKRKSSFFYFKGLGKKTSIKDWNLRKKKTRNEEKMWTEMKKKERDPGWDFFMLILALFLARWDGTHTFNVFSQEQRKMGRHLISRHGKKRKVGSNPTSNPSIHLLSSVL